MTEPAKLLISPAKLVISPVKLVISPAKLVINNIPKTVEEEKLERQRRSRRDWYYRNRDKVLAKKRQLNRELNTNPIYKYLRRTLPKPSTSITLNSELLEYINSEPNIELAKSSMHKTIHDLLQVLNKVENGDSYIQYANDISNLAVNLYISARILANTEMDDIDKLNKPDGLYLLELIERLDKLKED